MAGMLGLSKAVSGIGLLFGLVCALGVTIFLA